MHPLRDVGFSDGPQTEDERPSYLWFHDHILDFTGPNVYRGLANVVPAFDTIDTGKETDPSPALGLPSDPFDISLELQDKTFDIGGSLVFDPFNQDGFLGDTAVVNGVVQPFHEVLRRKYRVRLLNGSNARILQMFLTNDVGQTFPMTRIATEGGLMAHPIRNVESFLLAMAERTEIVIDFADPIFNGQKALYLENRLAQTDGRKPDGLVSRGVKLLKFVIRGNPVADPSRVPDTLRPFATVLKSEIAAAERRTFRFDRSHGVFTINGEPVDIERSLAMVRRNTPQIWTLENSSGGWWHPIHVHSEFMRVLSRKGQTPALFERDGMARKDTILLQDDDSVEVFFKFRDFTGPFVFHCHNLEHEDMAMMGRFDII
jgi:FtsP/CotA-like multicopper oxidase with cupredoxin domain